MPRPNPVKQVRETLDLSQSEFGRAIGITQARVSQVEGNGGRLGRPAVLALFNRYGPVVARLELTMRDFLEERGAT